jgi:type I restriction enzyme S subunit
MEAIIDYRGKTPTKTSHGVPLVTAKIVKSGRIETPTEFIAESDFESWMRRGMPKPGDVVITTEAPLGEVAQLDSRRVALAQRLICLRGKPGLLDNTFLRFVLQGQSVQEQLTARSSGTTVLGIRQSELRRVMLPVPPLAEQRAIAEVLVSLDDKIELNRRMNQTLEALAAAIFKAWFIDFEPIKAKAAGAKSFPSMPQPVFDALPSSLVPASNSPSGEIPKGWNVSSLGEVVEQIRNAIEPGDVSPELRYIGLEHMPRGSICLDQNGAPEDVSSLKMRFSKGDILFGKLRPYFKKVGIPGFAGICSSDIIVGRPKNKRNLAFAIGHLSSQEFIDYCDRCSNGAKMPRVNWSDMARYEVVVAPEAVMAAATELFSPVIQQIHANIEESAMLAALRDLLLPKLLSGEVRVAGSSLAARGLSELEASHGRA